MSDETTSEIHEEVRVATTKDVNKVVFESANGLLYFNVAVNIWWHGFPFDIVVFKESFEPFRALIV